MPKPTLHSLFEAQRTGKQLTQVHVKRLDEARALGEAGVDILMCMHENLKAFRAACPDTFIISADGVNLPQASTPAQCVAAGFSIMQDGGDAVYSSMGFNCIEEMARQSIPVIGHCGYIPYRVSWLGRPRAVGKTGAEAAEVYRRVKRYEDAGAVGVEIEIVPARVVEEIARRTSLLIMSMGAGTAACCQYLFATDVLGTNTGHVPRHAKVFANLAKEEDRLHQMRVAAFKQLDEEVKSGVYPGAEHTLKIKDEEFETFLSEID